MSTIEIDKSAILKQVPTKVPTNGASDFSHLLYSLSDGVAATVQQTAPDPRTASVTHAVITGLAQAPAGAPYQSMSVASSPFYPGGYDVPSNVGGGSVNVGNYPSAGANPVGGAFDPNNPYEAQSMLLDKMHLLNSQMLQLQMAVQQEQREFTTISTVHKSKHDTNMAMTRNIT